METRGVQWIFFLFLNNKRKICEDKTNVHPFKNMKKLFFLTVMNFQKKKNDNCNKNILLKRKKHKTKRSFLSS